MSTMNRNKIYTSYVQIHDKIDTFFISIFYLHTTNYILIYYKINLQSFYTCSQNKRIVFKVFHMTQIK